MSNFEAEIGFPPPFELGSGLVTDPDYVRISDINIAIGWLQQNRARLSEDFEGQYLTSIALLRNADDLENAAIHRALSQAENLDEQLSFEWLYSPSGGWVFHLLVWSWFGVFAHTLVALSASVRAKYGATTKTRFGETAYEGGELYSPQIFLLIFPRLVMAPLIAIVVLALAVTELTGISVTVSNLPMFLIFSFITGFASERFTGVIREVVNYFIPRLRISEHRAELAYGEEARARVRALNRNRPGNIREFRDVLKDNVRTEMGLALQAAKRPLTSQTLEARR